MKVGTFILAERTSYIEYGEDITQYNNYESQNRNCWTAERGQINTF